MKVKGLVPFTFTFLHEWYEIMDKMQKDTAQIKNFTKSFL